MEKKSISIGTILIIFGVASLWLYGAGGIFIVIGIILNITSANKTGNHKTYQDVFTKEDKKYEGGVEPDYIREIKNMQAEAAKNDLEEEAVAAESDGARAMRCPNCGGEIDMEAKKCMYCGAKIR